MSTRTGILVATLLPIFSACTTLESVDRGLHSASSAVTQRDKITGMRTISLQNRSQQIQKGNAYAEQFLAKAKVSGKKLNKDYDPVAYERITRIFSRLHQISHVRDETWTPVLVEENEWNAFTTGGTYFVINSGLEKDLKDDDELANVIAHEMAHTVANHAFESQSYMQLNALAGSKSVKRETFQAAFTHENEAEADRVAVLYCALAGYDPSAGARIWQRMHQKTGNDALFVHDHPMNSERAGLAQHTANLAIKYYTPNQINPNYESILKKNDVFGTQSSSKVAAGKGGGVLTVLETALTTMQQRERGKLEEQKQQLRIQFMQSVHRVSSIVASSPVAQNRWRVTVKYAGNQPLTDLGFKLSIQRIGQSPLVITQQLGGVLYPNTTFNVNFESPELDAYRTNNRNVSFVYDEARAI